MDKIRIKGKLIDYDCVCKIRNNFLTYIPDYAEIELPPVDISKIKEGDEVLLIGKYAGKTIYDYLRVDRVNIVAHFPSPSPEPEKKHPIDLGDNITCGTCGKQFCLCPERQADKSWEPIKPAQGKIEELEDFLMLDTPLPRKEYENIKMLWDKLNELIRAFNQKEGK